MHKLNVPVPEKRGGVHNVLAGAVVGGRDVAADDGSAAAGGGCGKLLDDLSGASDEGGFLEEVGRGISAHAKLRKENEVGISLLSAADEIEDFLCVSAEVADGGVDLGERDLHNSSVATGNRLLRAIRLQYSCLPDPGSAM